MYLRIREAEIWQKNIETVAGTIYIKYVDITEYIEYNTTEKLPGCWLFWKR